MKIRTAAALAFFLACAPVLAQQTPNHSIPIGRGTGITGYGAAVPSTAGQPLVSQGATTDPAFGTIANSGFTAGPANSVKGSLDGTSVGDEAVPACTGVNQALRWTAGVGFSCGTVSVTTGFDMPVNLGLSASASGNALTITLTQASGSAPTGTSPVLVPFRSTTATAGTVTWSTISATQSIVVPAGATLGTSSGSVPFRVWIFEEYHGGTPELAVATCSSPTTIFPCAAWESSLPTSITIGGSSNSGGVLYATTGVAADAVRIIGYCDYASGLGTAGTWASSCTALQVFGPGIKKPGDVVQTVIGTRNTPTSTISATFVTSNITASVSLSSSMNLVMGSYYADAQPTSGTTQTVTHQPTRGSTQIGIPVGYTTSASGIIANVFGQFLDAPGTTLSTAYAPFYKVNAGQGTAFPATNGQIMLQEIMG
jgi:hypothetical protein